MRHKLFGKLNEAGVYGLKFGLEIPEEHRRGGARDRRKVLNSDTADHNIHDMPSINKPFNESQMPTSKPIIKTFAQPEMMIPVQCNQHPWMRAYINVMQHPYFAVSAADGSFTIKNLPPGEYTLAAVHEKFGEQTMKVKVGPKMDTDARFTFAAQ